MATDAELIARTRGAQNRANTQQLLTNLSDNSVQASTTLAGVIEIATDAEAITGTSDDRALTPGNLQAVLALLKPMSFDGRNGAGACTLTGAAVGDRVIFVTGLTGGSLGNASASFESTITVINQIQQSSASDLSTRDYMALLMAKA